MHRGGFVRVLLAAAAIATGAVPTACGGSTSSSDDARDGGRQLVDASCNGRVVLPAGYVDLCAGGPFLDRVVLSSAFDYVSLRTVGSPITVLMARGEICKTALDRDACTKRVASEFPGGAAAVGRTFALTTLGDTVTATFETGRVVVAGASLETDIFAGYGAVPCGSDGRLWAARRAASGRVHLLYFDSAQGYGDAEDGFGAGSTSHIVRLPEGGSCTIERPWSDDP